METTGTAGTAGINRGTNRCQFWFCHEPSGEDRFCYEHEANKTRRYLFMVRWILSMTNDRLGGPPLSTVIGRFSDELEHEWVREWFDGDVSCPEYEICAIQRLTPLQGRKTLSPFPRFKAFLMSRWTLAPPSETDLACVMKAVFDGSLFETTPHPLQPARAFQALLEDWEELNHREERNHKEAKRRREEEAEWG